MATRPTTSYNIVLSRGAAHCPNLQVKNNKANNEAPRKTGAFQIIADLIAYPLERKTSDENIEFISSLKQKAAELL